MTARVRPWAVARLLAAALLVGACAPEGSAAAAPPESVAPGGRLPSSRVCAERSKPGVEHRPENHAANHSTPPAGHRAAPWPVDGYAPEFNSTIVPRIEGQFTGTTDQILGWGACRWGFPSDVVRAMGMEESEWRQSHAGDLADDPASCVGGAHPPCPSSFGLMQLKDRYRPGSWPYSHRHTAFNVDYALGAIRGCFEGWVSYLGNGYTAGDLWGCLGWHFSGDWRDSGALGYIERVERRMADRAWARGPGFGAG